MAHTTATVLNVPLHIVFLPTKDRWLIRRGKLAKRYGELFMAPAPSLRRVQMDAWELRSNFLANMPDEHAVLAFLNATGRFSSHGSVHSVQEFLEWQRVIHDLLETSSFHKAHGSPRNDKFMVIFNAENEFRFSLDIWKGAEEGVAVIEAKSSLQAIVATVLIDRIRGTKIQFCARPDCGRPYAVTSSHERKYCESYCAHVESVRRTRRKKRKQHKSKEEVQ